MEILLEWEALPAGRFLGRVIRVAPAESRTGPAGKSTLIVVFIIAKGWRLKWASSPCWRAALSHYIFCQFPATWQVSSLCQFPTPPALGSFPLKISLDMDSRDIKERLLSIHDTPGSPWGDSPPRRTSPNQALQQLLAMGFSPNQCERAITYSGSDRVEDLLNFVLEGDRGWEHPFIPREDDENLCLFCNDVQYKHVSELAPNSWTDERAISTPRSGALEHYQKHTDICGICYEEVKQPWSLEEDHMTHVYCRGCVIDYVQSLVVEGKVEKIPCPGVTCGKMIEDREVVELVDGQMYEKYQRFKLRNELMKDPSLRWCSQPNCTGYMHGSDSNPEMTCPVCSCKQCFLCGSNWHPDQSCDQIQDKEYTAWATVHEVQLCPQCRRPVEKNAGCNHMTCICCHYEFCWLCRQHYTSNHFNPMNPFGCAGLQGSDNVKRNWPRWRIYTRRAWILLLWALLVVFFPVVLFLCPAFFAAVHMAEYSHNRSSACRCLLVTFAFILTVLLTPAALVLLFPTLLIILLIRCYRYVCYS